MSEEASPFTGPQCAGDPFSGGAGGGRKGPDRGSEPTFYRSGSIAPIDPLLEALERPELRCATICCVWQCLPSPSSPDRLPPIPLSGYVAIASTRVAALSCSCASLTTLRLRSSLDGLRPECRLSFPPGHVVRSRCRSVVDPGLIDGGSGLIDGGLEAPGSSSIYWPRRLFRFSLK